MKIQQTLENYQRAHQCTLLGIGPMSLNCVDSCIELANDFDVPLILIASRRQIDADEFGGGYVNNWDTVSYANYVKEKDLNKKIIIARDHGGPWQNENEISNKLNLNQAMHSAKSSYMVDIEAGFDILHIDPSVDIEGNPTLDDILDRVYELYEFCANVAKQKNKEIIFEIGTEEQSGSTNTQEELEYTLNAMNKFCKNNGLPQPGYIVVQTGTKVMETRNVGTFDSPIRLVNELPAEIQVPKCVEICKKNNILMKEHNTDYLSDDALQWHPRLGIHSANVAPEFGVAESTALVRILNENNLKALSDSFLELSYNSLKWKKWMLSKSKANDKDRAIIAGHYVFATEEFKIIKNKAIQLLKKKNIDLDDYLKKYIKEKIVRYLKLFRITRKI